MLSRYERIERKANVLKRLDPEREVELEDAFTNHYRIPFAQAAHESASKR
jgi:hypothetical protein